MGIESFVVGENLHHNLSPIDQWVQRERNQNNLIHDDL